jgi:hypothetical protein
LVIPGMPHHVTQRGNRKRPAECVWCRVVA